jgi:hypothetical protein
MKITCGEPGFIQFAYRSPHPQAFCERTAKVRVVVQITGIPGNLFQENPVKRPINP